MKIYPISDPLSEEKLADVVPVPRPFVSDEARIARLNLFPGRNLTAEALQREQSARVWPIERRGQAVTAGVVDGMEVTLMGNTAFQIAAGQALCKSGIDVVVDRAVTVQVRDLRLYDPAANPPLSDFLSNLDSPEAIESIAVLVLQPGYVLDAVAPLATQVQEDVSAFVPVDQVPEDESFFKKTTTDAYRALLFRWHDAPAVGALWRNRVAWAVFDAQRQGLPLPWLDLGAPLAIVALDVNRNPLWIDRYSVVREGGRSNSRILIPNTGEPRLWQAQFNQFSNQLTDVQSLDLASANFATLPPVGVLPKAYFNWAQTEAIPRSWNITQSFFPPNYLTQISVAPLEQLDALIAESLSLEPYQLDTADSVSLLLPVSQQWFDPNLLKIDVPDPSFQQTIDQLKSRRGDVLAERLDLRNRYSALNQVILGAPYTFPDPDPQQLETPEDPLGIPPLPDNQFGVTRGGEDFANATYTVDLQAQFVADATNSLKTFTPADQAEFQDLLAGTDLTDADRAELNAYVAKQNQVQAEEAAKLSSMGINDFLTYLSQKADAADELLDSGFLKVRTDVYRLSQLLTNNSLGSQFVASPTLSNIIERRAGLTDSSSVNTYASQLLANFAPTALKTQATTSSASSSGTPANTPQIVRRQLTRAGGLKPVVLGPVVQPAGGGAIPVVTGHPGLGGGTPVTGPTKPVVTQPAAGGGIPVITQPAGGVIPVVTQPAGGVITAPQPAAGGIPVTLPTAGGAINKPIGSVLGVKNIGVIVDRDPTGGVLGTLSNAGATAAASKNDLDAVQAVINSSNLTSSQKAAFENLRNTTDQLASASGQAGLAEVAAIGNFANSYVENLNTLSQKQIRNIPLDRLTPPLAPQVRQDIADGRLDIFTQLARLNISLADLTTSFVDSTPPPTATAPQPPPRIFTFQRLLMQRKLDVINPVDAATNTVYDADESQHFASGVKYADITVAAMRAVEARVGEYRAFITRGQQIVAQLQGFQAQVQTALDGAADELDEARHDVAVAEALLQEEEVRLDALNGQREQILNEHVEFVVFHRPRAVNFRQDAPMRVIEPALTSDPIPDCLKEDLDLPPDLATLRETFRGAPAKWFAASAAWIASINRWDQMKSMFDRVAIRTESFSETLNLTPSVSSGRYTTALSNVFTNRIQIAQRYVTQATQINFAILPSLSWIDLRNQAQNNLTIGHLIDSAPATVSNAASLELTNIFKVGACLHRDFSEVPAAVRLIWAEKYSQYTGPANFRDLSALPSWQQIEFTLRREMQIDTDWLFAQIDTTQSEAVNMMNDLIRVCLLLASHAPVDQLITASVIEPVTPSLGGILKLRIDPQRVHLGMEAVLSNATSGLVKATVEDISAGQAIARVTAVPKVSFTIAANTSMRLQEAREY